MQGESVREWIGKEVSVQVLREGTPKKFKAQLVGAEELGITVNYDTSEARDQTRFFPWHVVLWVHKLKSG